MTYVIGKTYEVPAVLVSEWHGLRGVWIPIIGPRHEDAEFILFQHWHYHINWQFASQSVIDEQGVRYGIVVCSPDKRGLDVVIAQEVRRMTCKRIWPPYPYPQATWLPALTAAFRHCKLGPDMICPHRGLPLAHAPRDGDIVTCPGHGLRWNVHTGEIVTIKRGKEP